MGDSHEPPLACIQDPRDPLARRPAKADPDDPNRCDGAVHYRAPLSATGEPYPRCERHWSLRLQLEDRLRADYPDSDTPPAWFDPTAAGERWDSDY